MPDSPQWRLFKVHAKDSKAKQLAGLVTQGARRIEMAPKRPILGVKAR